MTDTREVAVMGATGNVGGALSRLLLERGVGVRALGRSPERLEGLARLGADAWAGDARDAAHLTEAFRGADAAFTLLPYDPSEPDYAATQAQVGEATTEALRAAGVRRVVLLSSLGADGPAAPGFLLALHEQEQRLRTLPGTEVLVLRPGFFFENLAHALPLVESEGIYADTVAPDAAMPMIAARDIAAAAADALIAGWAGVEVRELLGPRDLSFAQATAILGEALGRPGVPYVQLAEADMEAALLDGGFSPGTARLQLELNRALSDGTVRARESRSSRNTTPTSFERFAAELARDRQPVA